MPVVNRTVSVGTAITQIAGPSINTKTVYVQDGDYGTQSQVYVGGDSVTTDAGVKLSKVNVAVFEINADDALYAVGDAETSSVRVTEIS